MGLGQRGQAEPSTTWQQTWLCLDLTSGLHPAGDRRGDRDGGRGGVLGASPGAQATWCSRGVLCGLVCEATWQVQPRATAGQAHVAGRGAGELSRARQQVFFFLTNRMESVTFPSSSTLGFPLLALLSPQHLNYTSRLPVSKEGGCRSPAR